MEMSVHYSLMIRSQFDLQLFIIVSQSGVPGLLLLGERTKHLSTAEQHNDKGLSHLPLWRLGPVLLQPLTFNIT